MIFGQIHLWATYLTQKSFATMDSVFDSPGTQVRLIFKLFSFTSRQISCTKIIQLNTFQKERATAVAKG